MLNIQIYYFILSPTSPQNIDIFIFEVRKLRYGEVKSFAQVKPRFLPESASH